MIDLSRSSALLGEAALARLAVARVAVIGVGGVGSWCAEALVRTGVGHILLMDDDRVAPSNVNRQCPATSATLGQPKVEVMAARLREINPDCEVEIRFERFEEFDGGAANGDATLLSRRNKESTSSPARQECLAPVTTTHIDLIVDAIDSVACKAELILGATAAGIPIVSSMGAALRLDPTKVVVRRFDKTEGDGLARALRQRFKKMNRFPAAKFTCVSSTEQPLACETRGSLMPVTCTFGMALAAEAIRLLAQGER